MSSPLRRNNKFKPDININIIAMRTHLKSCFPQQIEDLDVHMLPMEVHESDDEDKEDIDSWVMVPPPTYVEFVQEQALDLHSFLIDPNATESVMRAMFRVCSLLQFCGNKTLLIQDTTRPQLLLRCIPKKEGLMKEENILFLAGSNEINYVMQVPFSPIGAVKILTEALQTHPKMTESLFKLYRKLIPTEWYFQSTLNQIETNRRYLSVDFREVTPYALQLILNVDDEVQQLGFQILYTRQLSSLQQPADIKFVNDFVSWLPKAIKHIEYSPFKLLFLDNLNKALEKEISILFPKTNLWEELKKICDNDNSPHQQIISLLLTMLCNENHPDFISIIQSLFADYLQNLQPNEKQNHQETCEMVLSFLMQHNRNAALVCLTTLQKQKLIPEQGILDCLLDLTTTYQNDFQSTSQTDSMRMQRMMKELIQNDGISCDRNRLAKALLWLSKSTIIPGDATTIYEAMGLAKMMVSHGLIDVNSPEIIETTSRLGSAIQKCSNHIPGQDADFILQLLPSQALPKRDFLRSVQAIMKNLPADESGNNIILLTKYMLWLSGYSSRDAIHILEEITKKQLEILTQIILFENDIPTDIPKNIYDYLTSNRNESWTWIKLLVRYSSTKQEKLTWIALCQCLVASFNKVQNDQEKFKCIVDITENLLQLNNYDDQLTDYFASFWLNSLQEIQSLPKNFRDKLEEVILENMFTTLKKATKSELWVRCNAIIQTAGSKNEPTQMSKKASELLWTNTSLMIKHLSTTDRSADVIELLESIKRITNENAKPTQFKENILSIVESFHSSNLPKDERQKITLAIIEKFNLLEGVEKCTQRYTSKLVTIFTKCKINNIDLWHKLLSIVKNHDDPHAKIGDAFCDAVVRYLNQSTIDDGKLTACWEIFLNLSKLPQNNVTALLEKESAFLRCFTNKNLFTEQAWMLLFKRSLAIATTETNPKEKRRILGLLLDHWMNNINQNNLEIPKSNELEWNENILIPLIRLLDNNIIRSHLQIHFELIHFCTYNITNHTPLIMSCFKNLLIYSQNHELSSTESEFLHDLIKAAQEVINSKDPSLSFGELYITIAQFMISSKDVDSIVNANQIFLKGIKILMQLPQAVRTSISNETREKIAKLFRRLISLNTPSLDDKLLSLLAIFDKYHLISIRDLLSDISPMLIRNVEQFDKNDDFQKATITYLKYFRFHNGLTNDEKECFMMILSLYILKPKERKSVELLSNANSYILAIYRDLINKQQDLGPAISIVGILPYVTYIDNILQILKMNPSCENPAYNMLIPHLQQLPKSFAIEIKPLLKYVYDFVFLFEVKDNEYIPENHSSNCIKLLEIYNHHIDWDNLLSEAWKKSKNIFVRLAILIGPTFAKKKGGKAKLKEHFLQITKYAKSKYPDFTFMRNLLIVFSGNVENIADIDPSLAYELCFLVMNCTLGLLKEFTEKNDAPENGINLPINFFIFLFRICKKEFFIRNVSHNTKILEKFFELCKAYDKITNKRVSDAFAALILYPHATTNAPIDDGRMNILKNWIAYIKESKLMENRTSRLSDEEIITRVLTYIQSKQEPKSTEDPLVQIAYNGWVDFAYLVEDILNEKIY